MQNSTFVELLKFAAHAQAKKDVRYYLNGVLLDFTVENEITFVGTDGHRLAKVTYQHEHNFGNQCILSTDAVKKIVTLFAKSFGDVVITMVDSTKININGVDFELLDGRYPDYKRVIPNIQPGERAKVGFCPAYIAEAAKAFGALNKVAMAIEMQDALSSMLLSTKTEDGTEAIVVIMPIRL